MCNFLLPNVLQNVLLSSVCGCCDVIRESPKKFAFPVTQCVNINFTDDTVQIVFPLCGTRNTSCLVGVTSMSKEACSHHGVIMRIIDVVKKN